MAEKKPLLPLIGAAMNIGEIKQFENFLFDQNRDLELQDFIGTDVLDHHFDSAISRAKKALDGFGGRLGLHGPFKGFTLQCRDHLIKKAVHERIFKCLEAAEQLRASQVVLHSPYTPWVSHNDSALGGFVHKVAEQTTELLEPIVTRAKDIGCVIVIENIEDPDPKFRQLLVDMMDTPALKASLDTGHAHCAMGINATSASSEDHITDLGDRLAHVHIHDNDMLGDWHHIPGNGTVKWEAVFNSLKASRSNPRLILELRDKRHLLEGADYLISRGYCQ